ncbi:MAG: ABC transporter substrate-binding protein, partial [Pseudomonadota bacterium]
PLDWVHSGEVRHYAFDPEKAAALFDEAGWTEMHQGVRHNADGEPLRFELMTTAGNRSRELVQQVLQDMWKQAGVDVRIRNEPARVFFSETTSKRRFEAMAMFAWISSPENVPQTVLHSDAIPSAENGWSGQNYTGFRNERIDAIIDELAMTLEEEPRERLWHELQEIYADELPVLPLFFRAQPHIWPKWLEGVEPTGQMAPVTLAIENWRRAES